MLTVGKASWRSTGSSESQAIRKRAPLTRNRDRRSCMVAYVNVLRDNSYSATISRVIINSHRAVSRRMYADLGGTRETRENVKASCSLWRIWLIAVNDGVSDF